MSLEGQKPKDHDRFGPTQFTIGDFIKRLPRSPMSIIKYIPVNKMILSFVGKNVDGDNNDNYMAFPYSETDAFSEHESIMAIRKHIWNTFFNLSANYKYSDDTHYPMAFKIYLKDKLKITGIYCNEDLRIFVSHIRNAIFERIIYTFEPTLLGAAYETSKGNIKMYNPESYVIKKNWRHWLD